MPRASSTAHPLFSLAKVQMAWWTFIILGSFLAIYCVSGEMPDICATSLALPGISGGTAALNGLIRRDPPPAEATTGLWLANQHSFRRPRLEHKPVAAGRHFAANGLLFRADGVQQHGHAHLDR